jgi:hypothetical protein
VSTGIERGGRGCEGVDVPGVAGGVNAGLIIDGGRSRCSVRCAALFSIACFPRSSSELESSNGSRRCGSGEYSGGKPGEAWAGSSGMAGCLRACCGRKCGHVVVLGRGKRQRGLRLALPKPQTATADITFADICKPPFVRFSQQRAEQDRRHSSSLAHSHCIALCDRPQLSYYDISPHVPTSPLQSTRRSRPQTSSAFFFPFVSGTYHAMNAKKNADRAAKMK